MSKRYAVTIEVEARDERDAIELVRDPTSGEFQPLEGNVRAVLVAAETAAESNSTQRYEDTMGDPRWSRLTVGDLIDQLASCQPEWTIHVYEGEDCVVSAQDANGKTQGWWSCEPA